MSEQLLQSSSRGACGMPPVILTRSGHDFDLLAPESSRIEIADIAHALSNICRFTGHTHQFYSVAEHSWWCSLMVAPADALAALLHDAAEAYVGDVSSPLKALLPEYRRIEHRIHAAICARFGLSVDASPAVKRADQWMLRSEQIYCMGSWKDSPRLDGFASLDAIKPYYWRPEVARSKFLERFGELYGEVAK